jgi:hypothetical protein
VRPARPPPVARRIAPPAATATAHAVSS